MAFEIQTVLLFAAFVVFVILAYKTVKLVMKLAMVGIVSALFPVVANVLGLPIGLTIASVLFFAAAGMLLYALFVFSRFVMGAVEIAAKAVAWPFRRLAKMGKKEPAKEHRKSDKDE